MKHFEIICILSQKTDEAEKNDGRQPQVTGLQMDMLCDNAGIKALQRFHHILRAADEDEKGRFVNHVGLSHPFSPFGADPLQYLRIPYHYQGIALIIVMAYGRFLGCMNQRMDFLFGNGLAGIGTSRLSKR